MKELRRTRIYSVTEELQTMKDGQKNLIDGRQFFSNFTNSNKKNEPLRTIVSEDCDDHATAS